MTRHSPKSKFQRPVVAANFAITLDGKISTRNRTPAQFTSPGDKRRLLELRSSHDALLVGCGTLMQDNMSMTIPDENLQEQRRRKGRPPHPLRVVVSNSGRIDPNAKVFKSGDTPVVIYCGNKIRPADRRTLGKVADLRVADSPEVDLPTLLGELKDRDDVRSLICEGGPTLFRALAGLDLIDTLYLTVSPVIFGGAEAPTLTGVESRFFKASTHWRLTNLEVVGEESFLKYRRRRVEF